MRPDFQPATELLKGGMCQKRAQTQSVGFAGRLRIQRTLRKADTQLALMGIRLPDLYEPENDITSDHYDDTPDRFKTLFGTRAITAK